MQYTFMVHIDTKSNNKTESQGNILTVFGCMVASVRPVLSILPYRVAPR